MKVLVTGGAGYIGSALVKKLCDAGNEVLAVDDLSSGQERYVDTRAEFSKISVLDREDFANEVVAFGPEACYHMAAHKSAQESLRDIGHYSENIRGMISLLDGCAMLNSFPRIVFSSTAAVYGDVGDEPVTEDSELSPQSYYGYTKMVCEQLIQWYSRRFGFPYVIFRYFNVVGDAGLQFQPSEPKNLFDLIVRAYRDDGMIEVFGDDWPTSDGTAVRDYIDVRDLVDAHQLALDTDSVSGIFNLGTSSGATVAEVLGAFGRVFGEDLEVVIGERREGDIARSLASSGSFHDATGWSPKYRLEDSVESLLFNRE